MDCTGTCCCGLCLSITQTSAVLCCPWCLVLLADDVPPPVCPSTQSDGGKGKYEEVVEPMLTLWDSVVSGKFDATWVFMGWEGVEAEMKGVPLNVFMLQASCALFYLGPSRYMKAGTREVCDVRKHLNRPFALIGHRSYHSQPASTLVSYPRLLSGLRHSVRGGPDDRGPGQRVPERRHDGRRRHGRHGPGIPVGGQQPRRGR